MFVGFVVWLLCVFLFFLFFLFDCTQNGAGKTTTISILVGLYPPSEGEAFIYGHSVRTEIDEIRRIMYVELPLLSLLSSCVSAP
jgi:hypothetical protein